MTPFEQLQATLGAIAHSIHLDGIADGIAGREPLGDSETYMSGYRRGLYEYNHQGDRSRGVNAGDCDWLYSNEEEF